MTYKHIIKLKPIEDLSEKIIKEKGNTKCIFYTDDICRNGDKTRDCVNCARVEYHSLYCLNWDNQERLQKIIKQKEQEYEELKEDIERWKSNFNGKVSAIEELLQQLDQLKAENESLKDSLKMFSSTLDWALKSQVGLYKRQIDSSVPDDWEYEEVLVLVEQYIEKIKQTLAEIKKIAEKQVKRDPDGETFARPEIKQILQKISECEV